MNIVDRRSVLAAGLGLMAGGAWAGQTSPGGPRRTSSIFNQVISAPTGQNGYEELVAAADELRSSRLFQEADQVTGTPGALTLAVRRRVLADPPVARCLVLLRRGLSKSITSPRTSIKASTLLPELGPFRQMARLLAMQQYVLFADGNVSEALEMARVCLRLGQVIQLDTLIHGLVGIAIAAIGVGGIGDHLGQLAARDCDHLFRICREWMSEADPLPGILAAEQRNIGPMIEELSSSDVPTLQASMDLKRSDADPDSLQLAADLERMGGGSPTLTAALTDAGRWISGYYDRALAECRKPAWERRFEPLPEGGGLTMRLAAHLGAKVEVVNDRYVTAEAKVQLLAVHAAVLAHRWEHDRPPQSLAELNLPDLVRDPFTGQLLEYTVSGRRYRLASVGPELDASDPRAVNGRGPVTVGE